MQQTRPNLKIRHLTLARMTWLAVALLTLGLFLGSLPSHAAWLATFCTLPADQCQGPQLNMEQARALVLAGRSVDLYANIMITLDIGAAAVWGLVGAFIFWRRSDDRMAWLVSLTLVTFGLATFSSTMEQFVLIHTAWALPVTFIASIGQVGIVLFFYLFPESRFVPAWSRWLALAWALYLILPEFFHGTTLDPNSWSETGSEIFFLTMVATALALQIYRYRRSSNLMQRQQTKWVVYGTSMALGLFLVLLVIGTLWRSGVPGMVANMLQLPVMTIIPFSIGLAALRTRLWDIDVLIRRTLIYGVLTATLLLVYVGCIVLLQTVFHRALPLLGPGAGQRERGIVTVISTLASAALFSPLRRRIQDRVDRRFYRRKYDTALTLAAFGNAMRDEVDLTCLADELLAAVQQTMQPEHVSLWLARPAAPGLVEKVMRRHAAPFRNAFRNDARTRAG